MQLSDICVAYKGLLVVGYFMAGQSEVGAKVSNSKSPPGGALWLVYKWESLRPLSEYFYAQQSAGGGLFGTNEEAALRSRCRMIRYHATLHSVLG